jgi:hypothetical protein
MKKEQKSNLLVIPMVVLLIGGWAWQKGKQESKQERAATPDPYFVVPKSQFKVVATGDWDEAQTNAIADKYLHDAQFVAQLKGRGVHVISCDG